MTKSLVVITRPIPEPAPTRLARQFRVKINTKNEVLSHEKLERFVRGAAAMVSILPDQIDRRVIEAAGPELRIIANYAVGFDNIDLAAAKEYGIKVTNTPGALTESVAEHTFALMLAVARRIHEAGQSIREGKYKQWEPLGFLGPQLQGKTLGILGAGRIGAWVAHIARHGFDMQILYHDLERNRHFEHQFHTQSVSLPTLLRRSDVVTVHVPLVASTRHLIGKPELRLMKPTAILINTARGPIIDEKALAEALSRGQIWGAGLDVFEREPNVPAKLLHHPRVVVTPHIASATEEARAEMSRIVAENIEAVLRGRPPITPVS